MNFIQVLPSEVAAYGAAAAIVLGHLRFRCNLSEWCRVSQNELADAVGMSRRQVRVALDALPEEALERQQEKGSDRTVLYRVRAAIGQIRTTPEQPLVKSDQPLAGSGQSTLDGSGQCSFKKKEEKTVNPVPGSVTRIPPGADDPEFEEFWKAYPRREARKTAYAAYLKARKIASAETLLAGAKAYAEIAAARRAEAKQQGLSRDPVAHPASWLNAERWTDETIATAVPQSLAEAQAWINECWREVTIKPITDRTGMTYTAPPMPTDLTRDQAAAWRDQAKRDWIKTNSSEILRRVTMKAVS